jgi:hypothetical protein
VNRAKAVLIIVGAASWILSGHKPSIHAEETRKPVVKMIPRNLLFNGDFEERFQNGVAFGWSTQSEGKSGYISENPKTGRIGGGIYGADRCKGGECEEDVRTLRMSGKVHLVDKGRMDMVSRIREAMGPDALVILKLSPEDWENERKKRNLEGDIEANGKAFAEFCYQRSLETRHWPRCYYGLNEPSMNVVEDLRKVCRFELAFTRRLHELGLRSCVINHSTGTPGPKENMYIPEMRALLAEADYVGYHSYGSPKDELMCAEGSLEDFSLRWRQFAKGYQERGWRFPPVIYNESTTYGPSVGSDDFTPEMIRDDILCFEEKIRRDQWVVGMCIFVTGAWGGQYWQKWDITKYPRKIIEPIRERNQSHPVDAHTGSGSQVIGANGEHVDRAICQEVGTKSGQRYAFTGWFKFEFFDCHGKPLGHQATAQVGFDPTGQTTNMKAKSIQWSENLIGRDIIETDLWYESRMEFEATGDRSSLWIRFHHPQKKPSVRLCIDDLTLKELP